MIELAPVDFYTIQHLFVDFQKKSKCFEMPPDTAQFIGAYANNKLVGYFVIQGYENVDVEINQGYLLPQYRHLKLYKEFMELLENKCKEAGYKRMLLGTHNRFESYLQFAKGLGYRPQHLVFSKEI